jgi:exodeoxyribonuclease V alpha subunit
VSSFYDNLGIAVDPRGHARDAGEMPRSKFARQLRDLEAGAPALNLSGEVVHLAAEIAAFAGDLDAERRIALILLIVVSLAALEEGSTRFPVTGPLSSVPMRRLLGPLCGESFGGDGAERMRIAIAEIVSSGSAAAVIGTGLNDYRPLLYFPPFMYQHRIFSAETSLARRLAILIDSKVTEIDEPKSSDLLSRVNSQSNLSTEQLAAIRHAVTAPLTMISGGPGTGKTSIIIAMLEALARAGVDPREIALAAPTGKAANRIAESIRGSGRRNPGDLSLWSGCPEPTTVHRLLGYSPARKRFRYHRNNPLAARVVIVDEGSMLDLELMSHLLDAMRSDARLVILGDADQLPSVSAGAVFRDLLPRSDDAGFARAPKYARLTRSYRTERGNEGGSAIFQLARAINAGEMDLSAAPESARGGFVTRRLAARELAFDGAEWLDEEALSESFLERWYSEQVRGGSAAKENRVFTASEGGFAPAECESIRELFHSVARARVLCITRLLDCGSERVNYLLHRRFAHDEGFSPERDDFIVGEPVMMLRNDYERMLFNGDQGVVLQVRRPGYDASPMGVFPRGDNFVAFNLEALKEHLELCYAMTVHKAQGSEFDSVAVLMPDKDVPILTREILYTAVSRARRSVTIVGSREIIAVGLARRIERYSGLREQLAQCLSGSYRT